MNVADFFCGAGGFSEGFRQAGFTIRYAVDSWDKAIIAHRENHPDTIHVLADVKDLNGSMFKDIDIMIGSPPCQDFSTANQNPDPEKGLDLVRHFLRLVEEIRPEYWIMENVPLLDNFLNNGVNKMLPVKTILNAADFGVPQIRRRLFAGNYLIPRPTHREHSTMTLDNKELRSWIGWDEALGLNYDIPVHLVPNVGEKLYKDGKKNFGRPPGRPSHCLNTAAGPRIYTADRKKKLGYLSIEQCAVLMGFPEGYIFRGDRQKQIGNAVCPPVARALAEAILSHNGRD